MYRENDNLNVKEIERYARMPAEELDKLLSEKEILQSMEK